MPTLSFSLSSNPDTVVASLTGRAANRLSHESEWNGLLAMDGQAPLGTTDVLTNYRNAPPPMSLQDKSIYRAFLTTLLDAASAAPEGALWQVSQEA